MKEEHTKIWHMIEDRSKEEAIPLRYLSYWTGISPRVCKRIIRDLVTTYDKPIGSKRDEGGGYWHLSNEEIAVAVDKLRHEAITRMQRASALEKMRGRKQVEMFGPKENELGRVRRSDRGVADSPKI